MAAGTGSHAEHRRVARMPFVTRGSHRIRYELAGPRAGPTYVFVNGLTQYAALWTAYRDALVARHFRVATFDPRGQGGAGKRGLFIRQDDRAASLALLVVP